MYNNLPPNYSEPEDGYTCPECNGERYTLHPCCPNATINKFGLCSNCGEHPVEVSCSFCSGEGEISPAQMRDYNRVKQQEQGL